MCGRLVTPRGVVDGAVQVARGRIASVRGKAPRGVSVINLRGAYVAPGFIDLHVWGEPATVSRAFAARGTTAFLTTLGPEPPERLARHVAARTAIGRLPGAECLGLHLEGPFVNPARAGALRRRWMRAPTARELEDLQRLAQGRLRLMTLAPELPRALQAISWCRQRGIVASLGHSEAGASRALQAVDAGATSVTHVFNGMRTFHHRQPVLLDIALTDPRLTAMVIFDGVHVSPHAFRLLARAKGVERVALVTDSIRYEDWEVVRRRTRLPAGKWRSGGAYYTRTGVLAGSDLTMIEAVRNAVLEGGVSLVDAVRMASDVPARLLGLARSRGTIAAGKRADLVIFDRTFTVLVTIVGGRIVYQRGT